jgi:hypothetical protein
MGYLTYVVEIRPDAQPGNATNLASAADNRGTQTAIADATVRIARDALGDRITIIGQITDGGCTVDPTKAKGVPNVRVMLEDGSSPSRCWRLASRRSESRQKTQTS